MSLAILVAVDLLQYICEGGRGCPISSMIQQMIFPSLTLTNRAPSSASETETSTICWRDLRMCIGSFSFIVCLSWENHHRKNCLAAQLLPRVHQGMMHQSEW